ncbi:hypothetical protein [Legionella impletisoli]|uniref:Cofactor-independent phosphoglycerate mutase n=1 Tax=Legionella impletisoli TaxID=343510 RepID=A0A917N7N8_9GAMM|nr:hypothetical protein [Legionella impletisoli]GGI75431.1 hypothetical protein GCM10007966_00270 [Legionella impletisoli]
MHVVINAEIDALPQNANLISNGGNFYAHVLACVGYPIDALPVGALLAKQFELSGEWLVASPVYWEATHNDALMKASGADLHFSEKESEAWFIAFTEFVRVDGFETYFVDKHTWLLRCDEKPPIVSIPIHHALHQSMMPLLQSLDNTMYWQRFMTESQMFLSSHALNEQRNDFPINGIWLWGEGELHEQGKKPILAQTESLVRLAQILSKHSKRYEPSYRPTKDSLLLFDDLKDESLFQLQQQLKNKSVQWFWNNAVYQTRSKRWFARWRS